MRVKLASRGGSGRWRGSPPVTARKFGLTLTEVLEALRVPQVASDLGDCLQMTHFHMGSQVSDIRKVKDALSEAARVYVELYRLGAGLKYIDVGGGLGIDYDGSQTAFESSMNYTLQEYANDVVYRIKSGMRRSRRAAPRDHLRERSCRGRVPLGAGVRRVGDESDFDKCTAPDSLPDDAPEPIRDMYSNYKRSEQEELSRILPRRRRSDGEDAQRCSAWVT